jgi:hypothetical protein
LPDGGYNLQKMSNHEEKNNSDSKSSSAADHKSGGVDYKSLEDDINALYLVKGTGDGGNGGHGADGSEGETLSRHNPLTEFLKQNKGILKDLSQEEFKAKYSEYMKGLEDKNCNASAPAKVELKRADTIDTKPTESSTHERDYLEQIVLKFTTLSEANLEAPSFTVKKIGAKIGREPVNEVCVPSDTRLASVGHSFIEYEEGSFYLVDGGYSFSASIRIGAVGSKKIWTMPETARFSVGNSVFESGGVNSEGNLLLKILEGPLKGEVRVITKKGATLGRSSDNVIAIQDRELSRKHSRVEFNESLQEYCVSDIGSTNGTYIQLVGPYGGRYKLCINDHILVGRTGFSINRYDYGISEEIGSRQTMEDSCIILQNMDLQRVHYQHVSPQSFFGVFDGHGGSKASLYLSQHLHINVGEALNSHGAEIRELLSQIDEDAENPLDDNADVTQELDQIIISSLERSFLKTDHDFVTKSEYAQNGSTATTALIMGNRLYCANVGDSRSLLCRSLNSPSSPPSLSPHSLPHSWDIVETSKQFQ